MWAIRYTKHDIVFSHVKVSACFSVNVVNYVNLIQYILNTPEYILWTNVKQRSVTGFCIKNVTISFEILLAKRCLKWQPKAKYCNVTKHNQHNTNQHNTNTT